MTPMQPVPSDSELFLAELCRLEGDPETLKRVFSVVDRFAGRRVILMGKRLELRRRIADASRVVALCTEGGRVDRAAAVLRIASSCGVSRSQARRYLYLVLADPARGEGAV